MLQVSLENVRIDPNTDDYGSGLLGDGQHRDDILSTLIGRPRAILAPNGIYFEVEDCQLVLFDYIAFTSSPREREEGK